MCQKWNFTFFSKNIKKVAGKTSGSEGPRGRGERGAVRREGWGWVGGVLPLSGDARVTSMAPSTSCLKRVQSELRKLRDADLKEFALKRENARLVQGCDGVIQIDQTIWLRQDDESDLTRFTALICGVEGKVSSISKPVLLDSDDNSLSFALNTGTPYEFGMYLFSVKIPDDYPFQPPKVKHLTTDGVFRTNPNLYANGKVCLSILGTWSGPGWTQILTLRTMLLSIQTLFCEDPLQNEVCFFTFVTSFEAEQSLIRNSSSLLPRVSLGTRRRTALAKSSTLPTESTTSAETIFPAFQGTRTSTRTIQRR